MNDVDMEAVLREKHEYNAKREGRHAAGDGPERGEKQAGRPFAQRIFPETEGSHGDKWAQPERDKTRPSRHGGKKL